MCDNEAMKQSHLTVYIVDVAELSMSSHDLPLQIELLCIHLLRCCLIPFGNMCCFRMGFCHRLVSAPAHSL